MIDISWIPVEILEKEIITRNKDEVQRYDQKLCLK